MTDPALAEVAKMSSVYSVALGTQLTEDASVPPGNKRELAKTLLLHNFN